MIFNQYNYDLNLSKSLHEMKIVYCKALQNKILSKKKLEKISKKNFISMKQLLRLKNLQMNGIQHIFIIQMQLNGIIGLKREVKNISMFTLMKIVD